MSRPAKNSPLLTIRRFALRLEESDGQEVMLNGLDQAIELPNARVLAALRECGTTLYFLSNYAAETYKMALARFDFLAWFAGGIVSGEHGVIKPDPAIYRLLLERHAIDPHRAIFIDDVAANAEAARPFGIHPIHFTGPDALRTELAALGLL